MLKCVRCGVESTGRAWHWIATLCSIPGEAQAECYCPACAESEFRYFSKRCGRPVDSNEDPQPQ